MPPHREHSRAPSLRNARPAESTLRDLRGNAAGVAGHWRHSVTPEALRYLRGCAVVDGDGCRARCAMLGRVVGAKNGVIGVARH